jgi:hypothetical protein
MATRATLRHKKSLSRRDRARVLQAKLSNSPHLPFVTTGHSRSKNGIASLAYDPVVHSEMQQQRLSGSFVAAWIAGSSPTMTKEEKSLRLASGT